MDDNKKEKKSTPKPVAGRRIAPPAGIVWMIILITLGILLLIGQNKGSSSEITQSQFEQMLTNKQVLSAEITSQPQSILDITGTYKLNEAEAKLATMADPSSDGKAKYKTSVLDSERLQDLLRENAEVVEIKTLSPWVTIFVTWGPMLLIAVVLWMLFARQFRNTNRSAMTFGKSRAKMINAKDINVKFDDVAGADEAKEEVKEIVDFLRDPIKYKLLGGKIPKGCLLTGPPGTGKTLLAKAVACEAGVPFFSISGSDFVEMFVGVGASRVRDMFDQAKSNSPCLIFIDEIDAVGRSRFSGLGGGHDEREQTLNAMLVEMDGLQGRSDVIVLAATNRPDVLDSALLRPGRFDRQVVLDLPDVEGRRKILQVHLGNIRAEEGIDTLTLAKHTVGLSGADLANMCNEAALLAAGANREFVTQKDLEEASEKVRWGRERRSRRISDRERRLTAYHEAGHALTVLFCEHATPLHKVTIVPRGQALGVTFMLSDEDSYTHSKLELEDQMVVSMGGRVAEELTFGDITSGAAQDIQQASHIARLMVCVFGMIDSIGPIKYGDFREHVHVRYDASPQDILSPETAREIDLAVKNLLFKAHEDSKAILTREKDRLVKLAEALLERETLSAQEVIELLGLPKKVGNTADDSRTIEVEVSELTSNEE